MATVAVMVAAADQEFLFLDTLEHNVAQVGR
jgi:hypothetical protein